MSHEQRHTPPTQPRSLPMLIALALTIALPFVMMGIVAVQTWNDNDDIR